MLADDAPSCSQLLATANAQTLLWRNRTLDLCTAKQLRHPAARLTCRTEPAGADGQWDCESQLTVVETKWLSWRQRAGRLSCDRSGVGPTGGFCLKKGRRERVGGNFYMSSVLARELGMLFANRSVLDVGCGLGQYGRYFKEHAPSVRWHGIDGAEGVENVTGHLVSFVDISTNLPSAYQRRVWDYTLSLEVAEHVPRDDEAAFVLNLAARARRGVVLSWAPLGESGGHHHVNCQRPEYVRCAMGLLGFELDSALNARLRWIMSRSGQLPWLHNSLGAFRRRHASRPVGVGLLPLPLDGPNEAWRQRYLSLTRRQCPYEVNGCSIRSNQSIKFLPAGFFRSAAGPSAGTGGRTVSKEQARERPRKHARSRPTRQGSSKNTSSSSRQPATKPTAPRLRRGSQLSLLIVSRQGAAVCR